MARVRVVAGRDSGSGRIGVVVGVVVGVQVGVHGTNMIASSPNIDSGHMVMGS